MRNNLHVEATFGAVVALARLVLPPSKQTHVGLVFVIQQLEPLLLKLYLQSMFGLVVLGLGVFAHHSAVC